ncbi:MAG: tetratricopeptide repeat protein [Pyrinomonadaceae bacterium]
MRSRVLQYVAAFLALVGCLLAIWTTGRAGLSRLLSEYAVRSSLAPSESRVSAVATADQAVRLTPNDPAAHRARATALMESGRGGEAIVEFERAVALRPNHYTLWLELGRARDQQDDQQGALEAFTEAARLAPYYAQPHWQRGNVLFRMGQRDEAFAELRRAAMSDVTLLPASIDLAWAAYAGDTRAVEQVFQPQTAPWRLALARYFAKHGKPAEAVEQFRAAGQIPDYERRAFLMDLLTARQFPEAYEVWSGGLETKSAELRGGKGRLTDGSFESGLKFDDPGFGWQLIRLPALRYSLDTVEPKEGAHSVRIDFNGDFNPAFPIISQLVLVEPNARYRLHFASRSQEMVTGGLPVITVSDPGTSGNGRSLAESSPLPEGSTGWQEQTLEFTTAGETTAVLVSLVRQSCGSGPCPIFGRLWLDQFSIEKL